MVNELIKVYDENESLKREIDILKRVQPTNVGGVSVANKTIIDLAVIIKAKKNALDSYYLKSKIERCFYSDDPGKFYSLDQLNDSFELEDFQAALDKETLRCIPLKSLVDYFWPEIVASYNKMKENKRLSALPK